MILSCHDDNVLFKMESCYESITEFNMYNHNKFCIHESLNKSVKAIASRFEYL